MHSIHESPILHLTSSRGMVVVDSFTSIIRCYLFLLHFTYIFDRPSGWDIIIDDGTHQGLLVFSSSHAICVDPFLVVFCSAFDRG